MVQGPSRAGHRLRRDRLRGADDKAVRKLFVGATRAMMKLVLVISERAAAVLLERHLQ